MHGFFSISSFFNILTSKETYPDTPLSRKSVIFHEAKRRGIRMQILYVCGKEISYARAWLPKRKNAAKKTWHYFEHIPIPPWRDSPLWQNLDNKMELKQLFEKNNIRVPRGGTYAHKETATRAFKKLSTPVIIKPLEGSRARHTRVRVTEEMDFRDAFTQAARICPLVLVEECIEGDVHRVTCVNGKLIAVMRFVRPVIIADGEKTTDELRHVYNASLSFPQVQGVEDTALFSVTLAHQGLHRTSIPTQGTVLRLADFSERVNGGYNEDVTDLIPPSIRAYIERAAHISGLAVVGFDVISEDISSEAVLPVYLEANTAPFIEIHHEPTKGTPRNIAKHIWDLWLPSEQ